MILCIIIIHLRCFYFLPLREIHFPMDDMLVYENFNDHHRSQKFVREDLDGSKNMRKDLSNPWK